MNKIQIEDTEEFAKAFELSEYFENSSFLVTGATGLIGSTLVKCLISLNRNIKITIPVRNKEKAKKIYENDEQKLEIIECELENWICSVSRRFDYIVHCASPTSGKFMIEHPVETYCLAIDTTRALLELSKRSGVKSMVYISSLEYYGQILDGRLITEEQQGYIDFASSRSSYPMGKRAAEYLCSAFAIEYNIPVKIARLTQTFGAGISEEDNRVFAQFARSVKNGTDIVLHTTGESAKPYCYVTDCIAAILYIAVYGANGKAYNVANEDTYISIKDLAVFLRDRFNNDINIKVESHMEMGYAPVTKLKLSTEKLVGLGWKPKYGLHQMFERLIKSFQ